MADRFGEVRGHRAPEENCLWPMPQQAENRVGGRHKIPRPPHGEHQSVDDADDNLPPSPACQPCRRRRRQFWQAGEGGRSWSASWPPGREGDEQPPHRRPNDGAGRGRPHASRWRRVAADETSRGRGRCEEQGREGGGRRGSLRRRRAWTGPCPPAEVREAATVAAGAVVVREEQPSRTPGGKKKKRARANEPERVRSDVARAWN